jgi:acetyl-CoA C-acetyltransferase
LYLAAVVTDMEDVVLVDGVRTPHGALLGGLGEVSAVELGRTAIDGLLDRNRVDLDPGAVDYVTVGNAIQAGIGQVPGRQATYASRLPETVPVTTINEASGSGVRAMMNAYDHLAAGRGEFAVAGGMESMTDAPFVLPDYRRGHRMGDVTVRDSLVYDALWDVSYDAHMGELTERLVEREGIGRERQDEYALESNRRAVVAAEEGLFDDEIVPVETPDGTVSDDEGPRADTSMERLGSLPTPFADPGTISPGNASKISDGAGFCLLATREAARSRGLEPLATVTDYAVTYRDPEWFNDAVAAVLEDLLEANELSVEDIDRFEVNEAFAAQMIHVMDRVGVPRERLNTRGGAVAYGHPIGASGGMIAASLLHELVREDLSRGVVGMSVGGGGGVMLLLER